MAEQLHFVHSIAHHQPQEILLHVKNPRHKGCTTSALDGNNGTLAFYIIAIRCARVLPIKCIPVGNTFVHNAHGKAQKVLFVKVVNNIYYPPDCI